MAVTEPADWTLARSSNLEGTFPVLGTAPAQDVLQADQYGVLNGQSPPSNFSQTALALANHAASQLGYDASEPDTAPNVIPWQPRTTGELQAGNIDLSNRPQVRNADGSISTVRSISIEQDGKTYLIPTVVGNRVVSNDEAIANFQRTGQHLGVFGDQQSADDYAQQLHEQQAGTLQAPYGASYDEGAQPATGNIATQAGQNGTPQGNIASFLGGLVQYGQLPEELKPDSGAPLTAQIHAGSQLGLEAAMSAGLPEGAPVAAAAAREIPSWMSVARKALDEAAAQEAMRAAAPEAFEVGRGGIGRTASIRPEDITPRQTIVQPQGLTAGAQGGAEFTPESLQALIDSKKAAGLTPEAILADPEVQAAQAQVFKLGEPKDYNAPENLGGGQALSPEAQANLEALAPRAAQSNMIRDSLANAREAETGSGTVLARGEVPPTHSASFVRPDGSVVVAAKGTEHDALANEIRGEGVGPSLNNIMNEDGWVTMRQGLYGPNNLVVRIGHQAPTPSQMAAIKDAATGQQIDYILYGPTGGDSGAMVQRANFEQFQRAVRDTYAGRPQSEVAQFHLAGDQPNALDKVIGRNVDELPAPTRTTPDAAQLQRIQERARAIARGEAPAVPKFPLQGGPAGGARTVEDDLKNLAAMRRMASDPGATAAERAAAQSQADRLEARMAQDRAQQAPPEPSFSDFMRGNAGGTIPPEEPPMGGRGGGVPPHEPPRAADGAAEEPPVPNVKDGKLRATASWLGKNAVDIASIPRSVNASADLSGSMRQAGYLGPRHYSEWADSFGKQVQALVSGAKAEDIRAQVESAPLAHYRPDSLALWPKEGTGIGAREEQFASKLVQNFPGIKQTERAYETMVYTFRASLFDAFTASLEPAERTASRLDEYAKYVNAATGRGNLPEWLKQYAPALNATLFSPRFAWSIPERLSYLVSRDPKIRAEAAKDALAFYSTGATLLGSLVVAKQAGLLPGVDVNLGDVNSADWGKGHIGPLTFDIWGGNQQFARAVLRSIEWFAQEGTGQKTGQNPVAIWSQYLRYKASPSVNLEEWARTGGKNAIGQKVSPTEMGIRSVTPFMLQDMYDAFKAGGIGAAAGAGVASGLGLGVQSNAPTPTPTGRRPAPRPVAPRPPSRPRSENIGGAIPALASGGIVKDGEVTPIDESWLSVQQHPAHAASTAHHASYKDWQAAQTAEMTPQATSALRTWKPDASDSEIASAVKAKLADHPVTAAYGQAQADTKQRQMEARVAALVDKQSDEKAAAKRATPRTVEMRDSNGKVTARATVISRNGNRMVELRDANGNVVRRATVMETA